MPSFEGDTVITLDDYIAFLENALIICIVLNATIVVYAQACRRRGHFCKIYPE